MSLVYKGGDIKGAKTVDGKEQSCSNLALCWSECGWSVRRQGPAPANSVDFGTHQNDEEEARLYKDLPVLFNVERGSFLEPDEDNHELKICDEHPGYCNWVAKSQKCPSRPPSHYAPPPQPQPKPPRSEQTFAKSSSLKHMAAKRTSHWTSTPFAKHQIPQGGRGARPSLPA